MYYDIYDYKNVLLYENNEPLLIIKIIFTPQGHLLKLYANDMKHIYGFYTIITSNKVKDEERVSFVRMSGIACYIVVGGRWHLYCKHRPEHELFEANIR